MPKMKQALWIAGIAVLAVAFANRTFARDYVSGVRKVAGVL